MFESGSKSRLSGNWTKGLVSLFSALLALFLAFSTVAPIALADDSDYSSLIPDGVERTPEGFEKELDRAFETRDVDPNSFAYVFSRMFSTGYMNDVREAVGEGKPESGFLCDPDKPSSLLNHNCDIPNFSTEALQAISSVFFNTGIINGEKQSAKSPFGMGVPDVPGNKVPEDTSNSDYKYTGLEKFGYNLRYSTYVGEWDNIKTLNSARLLSNFGALDTFKVGWKAISGGISAGFERGSAQAWDRLSSGDILGAVGGAFSGFFEGATGYGFRTILDTSDLNVVNTYGWYRPDFAKRGYGFRELSEAELSAKLKASIESMVLSGGKPEDGVLNEESQAVQNPPRGLEVTPAKCVISLSDGSTLDQETADESKCKDLEEKTANSKSSEFTPEKTEALEEWQKANAKWINYGHSRNMSCNLDGSGSDSEKVANFISCWRNEIPDVLKREIDLDQDKKTVDWQNLVFGVKNFINFAKSADRNSFSNPANRFVCVDENGKDIPPTDGSTDLYMYVYNLDGTLNPECGVNPRQPIQGGLFGNGFLPENKPKDDTRLLKGGGIVTSILPASTLEYTNTGLQIAGTVTALSNTVIKLATGPILETLGINDLVVNFMEGFRNGVYFPLLVLVSAGSALYVLFTVIRRQSFGEQLKNLLIMVLTILLGIVLLAQPAKTLKFVDEIPTAVEGAVQSAIFNMGDTSATLCDASGKDEATRILMCNNWNAFVFTPWVQGQWGTSVDNLNAENTVAENRLKNSNTEIVGDASVDMGGGYTMKNWAVYQLDKMTAGSITEKPNSADVGATDKNMYRIVDAQAGPNGGENTDGAHLQSWAGSTMGAQIYRHFVSILSALVATLGFVTVLLYSFTFLELKFATTLMLAILPLILLMGVVPGQGRGKLKNYGQTLVGLVLQRIVMASVIAVFFKFLMVLANSGSDYISSAFVSSVACIAFLMYRKDVTQLIVGTTGNFAGLGSAKAFRDKAMSFLPRSVQTRTYQAGAKAKGYVAGAIGGALGNRTTDLATIHQAGKQAGGIRSQEEWNIQRRKGLGVLNRYSGAYQAGRNTATKNLTPDFKRDIFGELRKAVERDLLGNTRKKRDLDENEQNLIFTVSTDLVNRIMSLDKGLRDLNNIFNIQQQIEVMNQKIADEEAKQKRDSKNAKVPLLKTQTQSERLLKLQDQKEELMSLKSNLEQDLVRRFAGDDKQFQDAKQEIQFGGGENGGSSGNGNNSESGDNSGKNRENKRKSRGQENGGNGDKEGGNG